MYRFPFVPVLLACLFGFGVLPLPAAEDNAEAMLQAFATRLPAQVKDGSEGERSSLASQIQVLSALLAHGNYERAQAKLAMLRVDELPVELQVEWAKIESAMLKQAKENQEKQSAEWQAKVDQLVSDARATCLAATKAREVEPLLVRVTGLQLERNTNRTVLGQRFGRKLEGVVSLTTAWASYLDQKEAGNGEAQNAALKTLLSESAFPILTRSEIETKLNATLPLSSESSAKILEGLHSLEDLPKTVEELKAAAAQAPGRRSETPGLDAQDFAKLLALWEAVKKGDQTVLSKWPGSYSGSFTLQIQSIWTQYRDEIATLFLVQALKGKVDLPPTPRESAGSYAERVLQTLQEKRDYETMTEVYRLRQSLMLAAPRGENWVNERTQFETLAAARRFEVAGDTLGAITAYRSIVGGAAGKYFPMDEATEALKRLRAANPAAFADVQGVVLEELRSLRQQLQQSPRFPGAPYPR